jgi:hypothetical protein
MYIYLYYVELTKQIRSDQIEKQKNIEIVWTIGDVPSFDIKKSDAFTM